MAAEHSDSIMLVTCLSWDITEYQAKQQEGICHFDVALQFPLHLSESSGKFWTELREER